MIDNGELRLQMESSNLEMGDYPRIFGGPDVIFFPFFPKVEKGKR